MKRNLFLTMVTAMAGMVLMSGCTKEPLENMTEAETRIYITNHDSTANFAAFKTFSITDSVAVVRNGQLEKKDLKDIDAQFIQGMKDAMQQRRYVLVSKDQNPDLGINISRVYNTYTGVISYPSYWSYYVSFWDPYYWGYPGYVYYFPYVFDVYPIREGALSIDIIDLKDAKDDKKIKGLWNGLIRGEGIFNSSNVNSQIKALFDQSPYIKTN
jgi:hypothetical protein